MKMTRFMKFKNIVQELVEPGMVQPGLIIKCVATNHTLILKKFILASSTQEFLAFCDEERVIMQTVDPESVWELVNIDFEGDIKNE